MKPEKRQAKPGTAKANGSCPPPEKKERGFLLGIFYGLVPHTFCILFIVLSIIGATAATSVVQRFLYIPYFFEMLIALSLVFATVSAAFYLKRNGLLSLAGIRFKRKYLAVMYGTTLAINLLFFWVVFPAVAPVNFQKADVALAAAPGQSVVVETVSLAVDIPCPGHAPLISSELQKEAGITAVKYQPPSTFRVSYDPGRLSEQDILSLEVFQYFPAQVRP